MNLLNLQNATRLLTSAKNALDSFVFSNSSTSPSQLAIALRAEASLLVMPPEAATAMALLKSTLVFQIFILNNALKMNRDISYNVTEFFWLFKTIMSMTDFLFSF